VSFIFIVSLFAEIIQGLFGIGASDIDDVILNSFGGLLGILGYKLFLIILRDEKKAHTIITILSTIIGFEILKMNNTRRSNYNFITGWNDEV